MDEIEAERVLRQTNEHLELLQSEVLVHRDIRGAYEEYIFALKAERAPIAKLSDDVLLTVFAACIAVEPSLKLRPGGKSMQRAKESLHGSYRDREQAFYRSVPHQVVLSQVCVRWRRLILSTGTFWTTYHSEQIPSPRHQQFDFFLNRSAAALLSLTLSDNRPGMSTHNYKHVGEGDCPTSDLLRLLRTLGLRLRFFSLCACERACDAVFSDYQTQLPCLEELHLHTMDCRDSLSTTVDNSAVRNGRISFRIDNARLRSASFSGTLRGMRLCRPEGIQDLHLKLGTQPFKNISGLFQRLEEFQNLRVLHLEDFYFDRRSTVEDGVFQLHLPNLELLEVNEKNRHRTAPLFWMSQMSLPALRTLCIGYVGNTSEGAIGSPFPGWAPWDERDDRVRCFRSHPGITTLNFSFDGNSKDMIQARRAELIMEILNIIRDGTLPKLHNLSFAPKHNAPNIFSGGSHPELSNLHSINNLFDHQLPSWPKSVRQSVTDLLVSRCMQGRALQSFLILPTLLRGERRGKDYAADLNRRISNRGEPEDMYLDGLFAE